MSVLPQFQFSTQVPGEQTSRLTVVPPLENGDRLTRPEFHRRFSSMPDVKKAELIEGIVYMGSPVRFDAHGSQTSDVITVVGLYRSQTPGVRGADNATCKLDLDNEPQPDVFLFLDERVGGQSKLVDGYVEGAPELVIEIAGSSATIDLHKKPFVYQRTGVKEYLVWVVRDQRFVCLRASEDGFQPVDLVDSRFVSTAFPGLIIDTAALIAGDLAAALAAVQAGIDSPQHAAFVAALQARRAAMPPA